MAMKVLDPIELADANPMTTGQEFVKRRPNLQHWQKDYFDWDGTIYVNTPDGAMDRDYYHFLERCVYSKLIPPKKKGDPIEYETVQVRACSKAADELNRAVKALTYRPADAEPFSDPDVVSFPNGMLDLRHEQLRPHTPDNFNFHVLPFDYQPHLGPPVEWLKFLDSVWGDAPGNIRELQKIFGYYLSSSNQFQKIFFIYGPTRCGKGTIVDVLTAILGGVKRVATIAMDDFSHTFGMESLIGKIAMVIPDLRQSRKTDLGAVVERLLTISGNDNVSVSRKYKGAWQGKLGVRIIILSNDIPTLPDATGTVAGRFCSLEMTKCFLGKEDEALGGRLSQELPQIMNWGLSGLRLLRAEGFIPQENKVGAKIRAAATALHEFIDDELIINEPATTRTFQDLVFTRYKEWCAANGHAPMSHTQFKIRLEAMRIGTSEVRPFVNGRPGPRMWQGIKLVNHMERVRSPFDDAIHQDELELNQPAMAAESANGAIADQVDWHRQFGRVCDD